MEPTGVPAFELRVAMRGTHGRVHARSRLCWAEVPSSAAVLRVLMERTVEARRGGLELVVERAPADLALLLANAGLSAPYGPVVAPGARGGGVRAGLSAGELPGQAEVGET